MHFCVSFISAWWFVWRFCNIMNALLFPTQLMCTRHSISERLRTYLWFQPGSVKLILFCKYSCIHLINMHTSRCKLATFCSDFTSQISLLNVHNWLVDENRLSLIEFMHSLSFCPQNITKSKGHFSKNGWRSEWTSTRICNLNHSTARVEVYISDQSSGTQPAPAPMLLVMRWEYGSFHKLGSHGLAKLKD